MQLNKYLAHAGVCSRREADQLIRARQVTVNGVVALPVLRVVEGDKVFVKGEEVVLNDEEKVYLAYHKPVGIICSTDKRLKDNIIAAIGYHKRVFPIGRLDVATSGLILLTDDGEIVNGILKGRHAIEKEYIVDVDKSVTQDKLSILERGVMLDGHRTLPAKAVKMGSKKFSLTIVEGKNRQVRRMCEPVGWNVMRLKRIRIGKLVLGDMPPGTYKELTPEELKTVFA
ncbi:MAG: pseudouridine synthase [bacterium]|nr:pseudouridine synthase [bacterium]